jgi:hypothetical protein
VENTANIQITTGQATNALMTLSFDPHAVLGSPKLFGNAQEHHPNHLGSSVAIL